MLTQFKYKRLFGAAGMVAASLFLEWFGLWQVLVSPVVAVLQHAQQFLLGLALVALMPIVMFQNSWQSYQTIVSLESQLIESTNQLARLQGVEAENEALRQALQAQPANQDISRFLARPSTNFGQPQIALQQADQVEVGQAVIANQVLLGKIERVDQLAARVRLLQYISQPILARTITGADGILIGDGRRIIFSEVPLTQPIEPDSQIVSVAQPGIPADLVIGSIGQEITQPADAVRSFIVTQPLSWYEAAVVEIRQ